MVLNILFSRCAKQLLVAANVSGDSNKREKVLRFRELYAEAWFSSLTGKSSLVAKEARRNKEEQMPLVADIEKYSIFLRSQIEQLKKVSIVQSKEITFKIDTLFNIFWTNNGISS